MTLQGRCAMTISDWLAKANTELIDAGISTARLDALVLLSDELSKDKSWVLAHTETVLTSNQLANLSTKIERRSNHEPLAYIRGKSEFYGREFSVNKHTLEPRPESETIIHVLKQIEPPKIVVDVGTGSGCLAISAALEIPSTQVYATDIDNKCIQTAQKNAGQYSVNIDFRQGNLLEPVSPLMKYSKSWTIIANLPYVPDAHTINKAAMFEPKHAIFGGPDGLNLYRQMFGQIDQLQQKPSHIITESLPFQHEALAQVAYNSQYKLASTDDFIQLFTL